MQLCREMTGHVWRSLTLKCTGDVCLAAMDTPRTSPQGQPVLLSDFEDQAVPEGDSAGACWLGCFGLRGSHKCGQV